MSPFLTDTFEPPRGFSVMAYSDAYQFDSRRIRRFLAFAARRARRLRGYHPTDHPPPFKHNARRYGR